MPAPLSGTSGSLTIDGTNIVWIGEWTVTLENNQETIGPHIGDPLEYDVDTSQRYEFKLSGTIPSGGDPGQNAIITKATGRTTGALVLTQDLGKAVTFSAARFSSLEIAVAADGTQTISAAGGNGAGTVVIAQDS
jgi:hypothetical protein